MEYEVSSVVVADKTSKRFRISSRIGAAAIVCVLILAISAPATTLGKSTTAEQEDAHKLVERRTVDINEPVNSIQDDMPTLSLPPNLGTQIIRNNAILYKICDLHKKQPESRYIIIHTLIN